MNEGKALLYENVLCYRENEQHGYGLHKHPTVISVVMAAPRHLNYDHCDTYVFDDDRDYMYCTLRAIFKAAHGMGAEVVVLPAFGCGKARHPPKEVASIMYKVIHEYHGEFKSIVIAIPPSLDEAKQKIASSGQTPLERLVNRLTAGKNALVAAADDIADSHGEEVVKTLLTEIEDALGTLKTADEEDA
jgi:hypothetical protein